MRHFGTLASGVVLTLFVVFTAAGCGSMMGPVNGPAPVVAPAVTNPQVKINSRADDQGDGSYTALIQFEGIGGTAEARIYIGLRSHPNDTELVVTATPVKNGMADETATVMDDHITLPAGMMIAECLEFPTESWISGDIWGEGALHKIDEPLTIWLRLEKKPGGLDVTVE